MKRRGDGDAGISLVEVVVALTVLMFGALAGVSTMLSSVRLDRASYEESLARQAARLRVEQMKGTTFKDVFATYNADTADDPGGAGTAVGATFSVKGLAPKAGSSTVGSIVFPTTSGVLREDSTYADLGMPRDLNGDNAVDAVSHAANYVVLPVKVMIQWRGVNGDASFVLRTVLCQ